MSPADGAPGFALTQQVRFRGRKPGHCEGLWLTDQPPPTGPIYTLWSHQASLHCSGQQRVTRHDLCSNVVKSLLSGDSQSKLKMAPRVHLTHHSSLSPGSSCPRCPGGSQITPRLDRKKGAEMEPQCLPQAGSASGMQELPESHVFAILRLGCSFLHT